MGVVTVPEGTDRTPEPPDGTRIEFQEYGSVWGDWVVIGRDDKSSAEAGWPVGDGGAVWCESGHSMPITWDEVLANPRLAAALDGAWLLRANAVKGWLESNATVERIADVTGDLELAVCVIHQLVAGLEAGVS